MFASPHYSTCLRRVLGILEAEEGPWVIKVFLEPSASLWWSSGAAPTPNTNRDLSASPRPGTLRSRTPWGAARGQGAGMAWEGQLHQLTHRGERWIQPVENQKDLPRESFMGTGGTGAPVNTQRRRRESPPGKDFREDFRFEITFETWFQQLRSTTAKKSK